jgi:hypothetical protein
MDNSIKEVFVEEVDLSRTMSTGKTVTDGDAEAKA